MLGSLFEANIERSKLSLDVQNQSPELWIKHSFVELQRVFETFESSMFISLVLGVVDDLTGTMYYVNAKHPGMVLYRGRQSQLSRNRHCRCRKSVFRISIIIT